MAVTHWHLTHEPGKASGRGNAIQHKSDANELATWARQHSKRPIYVEACTGPCRLVEMTDIADEPLGSQLNEEHGDT